MRRVNRSKTFFISTFLSGALLATANLQAAPVSVAAPQEARRRLVVAADGFRGTPYRYGGLSAGGLDCSGLVYLSFKEGLNLTVPRTVATLYAWAEPVARSGLQPGDLVFFNTTGPIAHVGVYAGDGRFIHAASEGTATGVIYSSLDEDYWRRAYAGAGRALPAEDLLGLRLSVSAAPSWGFGDRTEPLRGLALKAGVAADVSVLGFAFRPGLELGAQGDAALGVVRFPLTLSVSRGDLFRFFAGPTLSFGDAGIDAAAGERGYTADGGFFGELGLAWTPFSFRAADGKLALFGELAWQTYTRDAGLEADWTADLAANLRFSTGLRYQWEI
jgi:probable lipoprotein NlpC